MEMGGRRIPEDLMVEILKRLPVKSLLRFKSTSRGWCALIKSPNFIKSHLRVSPKSNNDVGDGFLFHSKEMGSPDEEDDETPTFHTQFMMFPDDDPMAPVKLNTDYLDSVVDFRCVKMHGCCDGILCLSEFPWQLSCYTFQIILWNPAIRQFKSLPNSTHNSTISHKDPDEVVATWEVAFGSNAKNDDYKVVAFSSILCRLRTGIQLPTKTHYTEVYCLKSNSWRLIDPVIPLNSPHSFVSKYIFNAYGHLHRVVSLNDSESNALLSLDMEDWVYRAIPGPPSRCISSGRAYGVVLSSRSSNTGSKNIVAMYYIDNAYYIDDAYIEVWVLNDFQFGVGKGVDGNCWTLKYKVEPPNGTIRPLCLWKSCFLLMKGEEEFGEEDEEEEVYSVGEFEGFVDLCLYDPYIEITKSICQFPCGIVPTLDNCVYKETLVSLT